MSRPSRDQWAMELAQVTAKRSTCCRRNVGCVLVNSRGHIIATGYNGVAAGMPHCNEDIGRPSADGKVVPYYPHACIGATAPSGTNLDDCQAIHAEQNALLQCKDVYAIHTAYVTVSCCVTCVKLLLNTSCERIVFLEEYPHSEAKKIWEASGRVWQKFEVFDAH